MKTIYLILFVFNYSCQTTSIPDPQILNTLKRIEDKQIDLETAIAKLDAKILNMGMTVKDQQNKLALLEKGLTLGIIPPELTSVEEQTQDNLKKKIVHIPDSETIGTASKDNYESKFRQGLDFFGKSKFDESYKIFSELEVKFPRDQTEGNPTFWRGRSWLALGEYEAAKKCFEDFLSGTPMSIQTKPSAIYYLAKTELSMNMKELAVKHLQEVIQGFPDDSSAQASRQLLLDLKKDI